MDDRCDVKSRCGEVIQVLVCYKTSLLDYFQAPPRTHNNVQLARQPFSNVS